MSISGRSVAPGAKTGHPAALVGNVNKALDIRPGSMGKDQSDKNLTHSMKVQGAPAFWFLGLTYQYTFRLSSASQPLWQLPQLVPSSLPDTVDWSADMASSVVMV